MKNIKTRKKTADKRRRTSVKKARRGAKPSPLLPILCRPGAELSLPLYLIGWVLRSLVLFCGVFGLTLFVGDGIGIYGDGGSGSIPALALASLILTVLCSASAWNSRTRLLVPLGGTVFGIAVLAALSSNPFALIYDGVRCLINTALMHMVELGYTAFGEYTVGSAAYCAADTLVTDVGCAVLAAVIAVILAFSLLRKVHTVFAVILSVVVIVPVFMYNLTRGNAGVSLVLIFILGEIALLLYEKKFSNYEARRIERKEKKTAKKKAKREKRLAEKAKKAALKRAAAKAYAISLELTGEKKEARLARSSVYTLDKKKKAAARKAEKDRLKDIRKKEKSEKRAAAKAKSAERKAEKLARRREKKEFAALPKEAKARRAAERKAEKKVKADAEREKRRERNSAESLVRKTLSASGYAGGTAVILAACAVWLPFATVSGNFLTIDFINDPVSVAREYVTAYLRGDDIDLNNMGNVAELTPRTLTYDSPEYKEIQMLAVETERADPVYLRGWIGMSFDRDTGTWASGTSEEVVEYRKLFGKSFTPDMLKTEFLGYMFPTSVNITDKNPALRFSNYGFDVRQIHIRRINGESLIIYAPPTVNSDLGILGYDSLESNAAKYSPYFDSIYSSRFFKSDVDYSTVSFTSKLNGANISAGLTGSIEYFKLFLKYTEICDDAVRVLNAQKSEELRKYDTGRGTVNISMTDLSDLDRLFLEECKRYGYPERVGDSLLARYIAMSPEERKAETEQLLKFTETEEDYREWAYLHYSSPVYSATVTQLAEKLLDDAGYTRNTRVSGSTPIYENKHGATVNQHDVVMTVIDHLSEGYTYTLEPTPYTGETEMTVLDSFLSETKNGYCSHFATAATALLREYGYSVRYCEGYLVNDFARNYSEGAPAKYKGFALDSNAHAWIEVYYPMIGWVAYETVPDYMEQMYKPIEAEEGDGGEIADPTLPEPEVPEEEPTPEPEPEVPDEVEEEIPDKVEVPDEEEVEEEPTDPLYILAIVAICAFAAALLFVIAKLIIRRIIKKAENAVADRHRHIITAMDTELLRSGKLDTMPIAKEFDDTVLRLLRLLGYPPNTGEQYSSYAARLENDFGGITSYSVSQIFELIGKVEFGHGLTPEEMYVLADFTDRLTVSAYAGLSVFEKIKYRYIKRII